MVEAALLIRPCGMPSFSGGGMPGGMSFGDDDGMNRENITLSTDDMEDLLVFVPGIADATISYTTTADVEGGDLRFFQLLYHSRGKV